MEFVQDRVCLPSPIISVRCADETPWPGLGSDHDSPMVAKPVMVPGSSGAVYHPSGGAASASEVDGGGGG